jgi:GNAT superfamily N-acetyltransferase
VNDQEQVERSAAAAWPASHTESLDGWLLRRTPGVARRRSNSALPPSPDLRPECTVEAVEAFYRAAGQPVTIQVSPAERHAVLDAELAARGYRREAPTLVLTASAPAVAATVDGIASPEWPAGSVQLDRAAGPEWLAAYQDLFGPSDTSAVARLVLARVLAPAAFARVRTDGRDVAIGLFVADAERAGVFCMATRPGYRRRGLALAVLAAGSRWAATRGCPHLYLQVELGNIAARDLYARVGFTHSYSYHYRLLAASGS